MLEHDCGETVSPPEKIILKNITLQFIILKSSGFKCYYKILLSKFFGVFFNPRRTKAFCAHSKNNDTPDTKRVTLVSPE